VIGKAIYFLSLKLRLSLVRGPILQIASVYHDLANARPVGSEIHLSGEDTLQADLKSDVIRFF
jgi:hypothetical protein